MKLPLITAALLVLGAPLAAEAQGLQPGMRTMIERGGTEGVLLGSLLPFGAYDPYDPYDAPAYGTRRYPPRDVVRARN